jgi:hypothetical protein
MFYNASMPEPLPLQLRAARPKVRMTDRVLRDFTRVCESVGILDPEIGLIRAPQRDQAEPSR